MVWFLERGSTTLVCETRKAADGLAFELSTMEPAGTERVERYQNPTELVERFVAYQRELRTNGWQVIPGADQLDLTM